MQSGNREIEVDFFPVSTPVLTGCYQLHCCLLINLFLPSGNRQKVEPFQGHIRSWTIIVFDWSDKRSFFAKQLSISGIKRHIMNGH